MIALALSNYSRPDDTKGFGENVILSDYAPLLLDVAKVFCNFIEELFQSANCTPEQTEIRLFSRGGRVKGDWRR
jgi:hypothetical protein